MKQRGMVLCSNRDEGRGHDPSIPLHRAILSLSFYGPGARSPHVLRAIDRRPWVQNRAGRARDLSHPSALDCLAGGICGTTLHGPGPVVESPTGLGR